MEKSIFEQNLERFKRYRATLTEIVSDSQIDLKEICRNTVILGCEPFAEIRYVPLNDVSWVFMTIVSGGNEINSKIFLEHLSIGKLDELNELMRKCMIIEELRNS